MWAGADPPHPGRRPRLARCVVVAMAGPHPGPRWNVGDCGPISSGSGHAARPCTIITELHGGQSIHGHHLAWAGDCFTVTFSSTKTDPTGTSTNDPKHCFSNPLAPEIDLLLALGIYFSVFKHVNEAGPGAAADGAGAGKAYSSPPLFPGSDQQKRFVDILTKVLNEEEVAAVMKRMGVSVTDIAGHSTRKGSATFVSSGSTDGVSYPALCRRCGWKMGVQERYVVRRRVMSRVHFSASYLPQ